MTSLSVIPYKLKITTLQLTNVKQKGLYAISYTLLTNRKDTKFANEVESVSSNAAGSVVWNEETTFELLNTFTTLNWSLQYKSKETDDSFSTLDAGSLILNQIPLNTVEKKLLSCNPKKFTPFPEKRGSMEPNFEIHVLLTRNDSLIKILGQHSDKNTVEGAESTIRSPLVRSTSIQYGAVYSTFREVMKESFFPNLSTEWCKDCIDDVNYLVDTFVTKDAASSLLMMERVDRAHSKFLNSIKLNLKTKEYFYYYPLEMNTIQINLNSLDNNYYTLTFHNRFLMWTWYKWILYAYEYWNSMQIASYSQFHQPLNSNFDLQNPPNWIVEENMNFSSEISKIWSINTVRGECKSHHGKCKIDLNQSFQLTVGDNVFDLSNMFSVILSCDSVDAEDSLLCFEVKECHLVNKRKKEIDQLLENALSPDLTKQHPPPHPPPLQRPHHSSFTQQPAANPARLSLGNTAKTILSLLPGAKEKVVSNESSPADAGVNIKGSTQLITSVVSNIIPTLNNPTRDSVVWKTESTTASAENYNLDWKGKVCIESNFGGSNCYRSSLKANENQKKNEFVITRIGSFLNAKIPLKLNYGLVMLLQKGKNSNQLFRTDNKEVQSVLNNMSGSIAEKYIPLRRMYPMVALDEATTPRYPSDFMQETVTYREADVAVEFNTRIGYSLTLLACKRLNFNEKSYDKKSYGITAKCKFVTGDGLSLHHSVSSPVMTLWHSFDWKNANFILRPTNEGFQPAEYLRVEMCLVGLNTNFLSKGSLGGIFIPLSLFHGKSATHTFPVVLLRSGHAALTDLEKVTGYETDPSIPLGSITFEIKRIEEALGTIFPPQPPCNMMSFPFVLFPGETLPDYNTPFVPNVTFKVSTQLSTISSTWWLTEVLLKGNVKYPQHVFPVHESSLQIIAEKTTSASAELHHLPSSSQIHPNYVQKYLFHVGFDSLTIDLNFENNISSDILAAVHAKDGHIDPSMEKKFRSEVFHKKPNHVLLNCEELHLPSLTASISYDRIVSASVITPSILCLQILVKRYFEDSHHASKILYQDAVVECFVSNCPAESLKVFIEDRRFFHLIRIQLNKVLKAANTKITHSDPDSETVENQEKLVKRNQKILSAAVSLFSEMNYISAILEGRLKKIFSAKQLENSDSFSNNELDEVGRSVLQIGGRITRIRLYTAVLFGISLECSHHFQEKELIQFIGNDVETIKKMKLDDSSEGSVVPTDSFTEEIKMKKYQINYLLESFEKRLIETLLSGWNLDKAVLLKFLEIIVNQYFMAILNLLAAYFEDTAQTTVKVISFLKILFLSFLISLFLSGNSE
jgi:hypothetical protein